MAKRPKPLTRQDKLAIFRHVMAGRPLEDARLAAYVAERKAKDPEKFLEDVRNKRW